VARKRRTTPRYGDNSDESLAALTWLENHTFHNLLPTLVDPAIAESFDPEVGRLCKLPDLTLQSVQRCFASDVRGLFAAAFEADDIKITRRLLADASPTAAGLFVFAVWQLNECLDAEIQPWLPMIGTRTYPYAPPFSEFSVRTLVLKRLLIAAGADWPAAQAPSSTGQAPSPQC